MNIYINTNLINRIYFKSEIIDLSNKQDKEVKRIYKTLILKKLILSKKFPRRVLHMRRFTLGIGYIRPKTVINLLKIKLYIKSKRK